MLNGFRIIDADSHVFEPPDMWERYLEPEFHHFALTPQLTVGGQKIHRPLSREVLDEASRRINRNHPTSVTINGFDPESQVLAMERMGIDMAFLYPSYGLWVLAIDSLESAVTGALTRAYNNWLRDFCSYAPERLQGVGAIDPRDPDGMVSELRRVAGFGWKVVFLRPNPIAGKLLSDRSREPFWSECERLGMAVGIHEGTHARVPTAGSDRFSTQFAKHACSHPLEQMMALLALIEGGVLERHPRLRVAFLESGCGWLPYWLWRLDEEFDNFRWEVSDNVRVRPSEYFRRQCFISLDPAEPNLPSVIEKIGADNFIFGADYPHYDHKADIVERVVALEGRLSRDTVRKLLWDNPARFVGLE